MRKHPGGFTLIELMMVVAILGIIAAIALPSYGNYVLRANRTAGKSLIMQIVGKQESFYTDRKQYAANLQALGYPGTAGNPVFVRRDSDPQDTNTSDTVYSIALTNTSATGYSIVATPVNRQTKDTKCGTLTYNSDGTKAASGGATDCWTR